MAKMHLVPIRRGYWGKNSGLPHTIPMKLSGTCGSVSVRLIPAPRGTGLVAAPASKKILAMAGLEVSSCVQQLMRPSSRDGSYFAAVALSTRNANSLLCAPQDCYSTTRGHSRTTGNFITAVFNAVSASYGYLSPELWKPTAKLRRFRYRKFHSLIIFRIGLLESAVPGAHRLPRQGGRVGQGRRCLLGTRHEYRRRPGRLRSPAMSGAHDPRGVSRTGLARKWSNNPKKNRVLGS